VNSPATPEDTTGTQFMTVTEVAAALRVSRATIYRLVGSGAIAATQIGKSVRITRRTVDEFIRHHARRAASPQHD
jgi:excisionase family DNA binding protein